MAWKNSIKENRTNFIFCELTFQFPSLCLSKTKHSWDKENIPIISIIVHNQSIECNKILGIFKKIISLCCKDSFLYILSVSRQKHTIFTLKWAKNVPEKPRAISNKTRYYDEFFSYSIEIHPISNVAEAFRYSNPAIANHSFQCNTKTLPKPST